MTDTEFLKTNSRNLIEFFHGSPIAKSFGMRLSYNENFQATLDLPYNANLNHALGGIHGGAIATMIDNAGWFTVAVRYKTWIATTEFNIKLLEPVEKAHLRSHGELIRAGKKIAVARMRVVSEDGTLVAIGSGTFKITNTPIN